MFLDRVINSLQVIDLNRVNQLGKKANCQTTENPMTYKYLELDHEDTPELTKLQNMYNAQSLTIF